MKLMTKRLLLRPLTEADAEDVFAYSRGEQVGPNAGWKPHESLEETQEILRQVFLDREAVFGIVLRETGRVVGSIGLIPDPKRENGRVRMLGYALGQEHWGRGYMTEAARAVVACGFGPMELDLISAYCYPHNYRSRHVLEKLGFQFEGTLRLCEELYDGRVLPNDCYSLRRCDWRG